MLLQLKIHQKGKLIPPAPLHNEEDALGYKQKRT